MKTQIEVEVVENLFFGHKIEIYYPQLHLRFSGSFFEKNHILEYVLHLYSKSGGKNEKNENFSLYLAK